MALEAQGNRVCDATASWPGGRLDMVEFDLHAAEAMADTATPMAGYQEGLNLLSAKLRSALVTHYQTVYRRFFEMLRPPRNRFHPLLKLRLAVGPGMTSLTKWHSYTGLS